MSFDKLLLFWLLLFSVPLVYGQETFLDNFSSVSYSNNNGSLNWATDWIENGDTDTGPNSQYIRISNNRLELYYLYGENIRRRADLLGASSSTLSFDWQAISLDRSRALAGTNAAGPFTVTYQTVDGSATAGSDYASTTRILNFNGFSGDTETNRVSILDAAVIQNPEKFTATSDGSVDITDIGTGTIVDDDALKMTDGATASTCNDIFFDPGSLSNYSNNLDVVYTICPDTADNYFNADFSSFQLVTGDFLYVYEGTTTGGTLIVQYDSANIPTTINSSDTSGCLTFTFTSNGSNSGAGWEATVNCYPDGPIIIDDISFDEVGKAVSLENPLV